MAGRSARRLRLWGSGVVLLLAVGAIPSSRADPWQTAGARPDAGVAAVRPETPAITTIAALRTAVAVAAPGDTLVLAPGRYALDGDRIAIDRPGRPEAPIRLVARHLGAVILSQTTDEGFLVRAPWWQFENLVLEGRCPDDDRCSHGFHVVGGATDVVIRNNCLIDFNAQIKVNGAGGRYPDRGRIEGNSLFARRPRRTAEPVTPIDIVAADGWVIRANAIADFAKAGGNHVSYGAFMKGGGRDGRIEDNLVVCRDQVAPASFWEARVGLSLGGGGSDPAVCRDRRCPVEYRGGLIRGNRVMACSDVGIDLHRVAGSRVADNILSGTRGIGVRGPDREPDRGTVIADNRIDRHPAAGGLDPAGWPARIAAACRGDPVAPDTPAAGR